MSAIGRSSVGYRKIDRVVDKGLALGQKKLVIAHKFTSSGLTDIDLTNLTVPTEMVGFTNPSTAQIQAANIFTTRDNVRVLSSANGPLADYLSYDVISNTLIRLKGNAVSQVGEIIIIYIEQVNMTGLIGVDAQAMVQTGTLAIGATDIVLSAGYFTYNKYATQQTGDVILIADGLVQMRNVGNAVSGQGNYYEIPPSSGNLSNTLRMNLAPTTQPRNYIVLSNGLVAERPTAAVLGAVQTLASTVDKVVQDLALVTGNPTSNYQGSPSSVDQAMFGNKVNSYISGIHYDAVVGSSAQLAAGQVTHTSVAAAIAAQPQGKILVLAGTYVENLTLTSANNNLMLEGKGRGSFINGTLSLSSSATGLSIRNLRFGDNISIASGCNSSFVRECWTSTGVTVTDLGAANSLLVIQE